MLAKSVEAQVVDVFAHCRRKLIAVVSRARRLDPTLTEPQVRLFEALITEALEDLAPEFIREDSP